MLVTSEYFGKEKQKKDDKVKKQKNVIAIKEKDRMITIEIKIDSDFKIFSGKVRRGGKRDSKSSEILITYEDGWIP